MRYQQFVFSILITCIVLSSCNRPGIPKVIKLENLKQTEFVPTLENELTANKNVIYSPSFLFAWNEVKQLFKSPILIANTNSMDLKLVDQSRSFKNSLAQDEYEAEGTLENGQIITKAFFNKSLPFPSTLQKFDEGILFNKKKVAAFGMKSLDDKIVRFTQILYYKDDDNFVIKLIPKDTLSEIVFIKGLQNVKTFADVITQTNALSKSGELEKLNKKSSWKYLFNEDDSFSIPAIRFNIETDYKYIEGQVFKCMQKQYTVQTAYQRTALILDENGAIVESEARLNALDSVATPVKSHPKTMFFNKPFYIIIKRVNQVNPYFVMKVENAELLNKI